MNIKEYLSSITNAEYQLLEIQSGIPKSTLYQIKKGMRKPGIEVCAILMSADSKIDMPMLRPELSWPKYLHRQN